MNPIHISPLSTPNPESCYQGFLDRVCRVHSGNEPNLIAAEFDNYLASNWAMLPPSVQQSLVSDAVAIFLRLKRTERNRYAVDALIAKVDDINLCPEIGRQTLLEYACGGSGEVDLGLVKVLLKAGHSLDRAPKGGLSPRQALENLYTSKSRQYYRCRILFEIAEDKALNSSALQASTRRQSI